MRRFSWFSDQRRNGREPVARFAFEPVLQEFPLGLDDHLPDINFHGNLLLLHSIRAVMTSKRHEGTVVTPSSFEDGRMHCAAPEYLSRPDDREMDALVKGPGAE